MSNNNGGNTPEKTGSSWWKILIAVVCAALAISPLDIIPEFIPVAGLADDVGYIIGIITSVISLINDGKKNFKKSNYKTPDYGNVNDVDDN